MYYTLKYKLKTEQEESELEFKDYDEAKSYVRLLHRWVAPLEWKNIYSNEDFETFSIWETNYLEHMGKDLYMVRLDEDRDPDFEHAWMNWFIPIDNNITIKTLDEAWLSSKSKSITFNWNILRVFSETYSIKKESKLRELLEMIFIGKNEDNFVSYDILEQLLLTWDYKEITEKDLNYEKVRWILKHKINEIKNDLKSEENFLLLTIRWITVNM